MHPVRRNSVTADRLILATTALGPVSPTQTNQMAIKDMSLTINCPSATKVAWSIADNKEDSKCGDLPGTKAEFHIVMPQTMVGTFTVQVPPTA